MCKIIISAVALSSLHFRNEESRRSGEDSNETSRKNEEEEETVCSGAIPKTNFEKVQRLDGDGGRRDKPNPKELEKRGISCQCGTCEKVVKDHQNGLQCDMCDMWFHCGCEKVSAEEYELLERSDSVAQWFCSACRGQVKNLTRENKLKGENKILREENELLRNRLEELERTMREIKEEIKQEVTEGVKQQVFEYLKEDEDKKERRNNLVIYEIKESTNSIPRARTEASMEKELILEEYISLFLF